MRALPPAAPGAAAIAGDPATAVLLAQGGPVAAALDALAAELTSRGWTADLRHPVGGPNGLYVRNPEPGAAMLSEHVLVAPTPDGALAYWWPWADQIAPAAGGDELKAWSPRQHGRHAAEIVIDQEGYLEIRHWAGLAADPAAATIAGVLASLAVPATALPAEPG